MNLLGGLEAATNFGTGFNTGQQQATNQGYQNRVNAVATDTAETQNQQMHDALDKQSQINDMAMKLWSPATSNPLNPGQPGGQGGPPQGPGGVAGAAGPSTPNGPSVAGQATDQSSPIDKMNQLASFAAGKGDLAQANQLWTNATNMATDKFKQQQEQAATQTAQIKGTIASHGFVAQTIGAATNRAEFQQAKMAVLSSPLVPQNEKANIANMQYSPQLVDMVRRTGMNSVQQGTEELKQLQLQEKQRQDDLTNDLKASRVAPQNAYDDARIAHTTAQAKVGAVTKGPTKAEQATADLFVRQQMGSNIDPNSPAFKQASASIAARAKQIVGTNRAITYPQALQQATEEANRAGDFTQAEDTRSTIAGVKIPFTGEVKPAGYSGQGQTRDTALPMPPATPEGRKKMVPGRWYLLNGVPTQYNPGQ